MESSKLWTVFSDLKAKEIGQLQDFLASPFHNTRPDVVRLFEYLREIKLAKNQKPDKVQAAQKIWPVKPYEPQLLRYTMSFLLDLIKQYFVHQAIKEDALRSQTILLEQLHERRVDAMFDQTANDLEQIAEDMPEGARKNKLTHRLRELQKNNQYQRLLYDSSPLSKLDQALDEYYLVEKLRIYIEAESLASRQDFRFDSRFRKIILNLIEEHNNVLTPLIQLYSYAFKALSSAGDLAAFQEAKSLLISHQQNLDATHLRDLYLLTINYGIKQMNRGNEPFFKETFELYRSGLEDGALLENGVLTPSTYKNITAIGLRIGEHEWVYQFINEYKSYLFAKNRENVFSYTMAIFLFSQKNYHEFAGLAGEIKSRDVHVNCDVRRMYAIMFYEQDDLDVLEHHLQSFKGYLIRHRGKLSYHFQNWNRFIRMMTKLVKASGHRSELLKLTKEIREMEYLSSKDWFMQQLNS